MTNRSRMPLRPALTVLAALVAVFAVAGGLPLAQRAPQILSGVLFGGSFYSPAITQLVLLLVGFAVLAVIVHLILHSRRDAGRDETGER
ncbi:hypothetical protein AB0I00_30435 [Streptomyces sp. NPDC050803]|uniref:hypothetical protein n=1 Tax=unclassified Streptomyces TaxID=2593676 RepID=UPI00342AE433